MEPFEKALQPRAKLQQELIHFVQNELALASTCLDVAKVTQEAQTRARNIENARKAYDELVHLLAQDFDCTDEQRSDFNNSLAELKQRLNEESPTK